MSGKPVALEAAFYKLLVRADISVERTGDRRLEAAVESAWREARGLGADRPRCKHRVRANGHTLRCIAESGHLALGKPCEMWLCVHGDPDGELRITELVWRR